MTDNVNAEVKFEVTAEHAQAEEEIVAAAELGKFKSVDALISAYKSLEAEFTRRSQRLKELEEKNKAENPVPVAISGGDGQAPSLSADSERETLLRTAIADEKVRAAVIEDYLKTVASNKSIPLIVGGVSTPAPKSAPKTVREAGALAEMFLKK